MVKHNLPRITVIIPVAPGCDVKGTLDHLKEAEYPKNLLEVFVIKGSNPSCQRNEGIRKAKGSIILFLDNDSFIRKDYLKRLAKSHENFDIVGGPALTRPTDTFLQKCFGRVIGSYFATQKMRSKFRSVGKPRLATEKEMILCNMSIKKHLLDKHGGFDERLYPNEENELLNRMQSKGIKILYDPFHPIFRSQRENITKFSKQFYRYGKSRMEHFRISPKNTSLLFFIPSIFVLYLVTIPFFPHSWYLAPLTLYMILNLIFSVEIMACSGSILSLFVVPFLFPLLHISYGIGIFSGMFSNKKREDCRITFEKVNLG